MIAMLVSAGEPLTRAVHEYTVSPLFVILGGAAFQLESLIVRAELVAFQVEPLGLVGEFPLFATVSENIFNSATAVPST